MKRVLTIAVPVIVIIAALAIALITVILPNRKRTEEILQKAEEAAAGMTAENNDPVTGNGNNVKPQEPASDEDRYARAVSLMDAGSYDEAIDMLWDLDYMDSSDLLTECYKNACDESTYQRFSSVGIGDTYIMGTYEQDDVLTDDKEPIEWIVLDRKGPALFLIARYGLDVREFNDDYRDITWENSSIRRWLNGRFLIMAFNDEEKLMIRTVTVKADPNPENDTPAGNDTNDKLFLLSIPEANKYFPTDEERKIMPTPFALSRGAYTKSRVRRNDEPSFWWLRSPGLNPHYAAFVSSLGVTRTDGLGIISWDGCVRPAMWIEPVH